MSDPRSSPLPANVAVERARIELGVGRLDLWVAQLAAGGDASLDQVWRFLDGREQLTHHEIDAIGQGIDDLGIERGQAIRLPLSRDLGPVTDPRSGV